MYVLSGFGIYLGFHIEYSVLRLSGCADCFHMVTSRVYKNSYSRYRNATCLLAGPNNTIVVDRVNAGACMHNQTKLRVDLPVQAR